jgi:hypothetical protein
MIQGVIDFLLSNHEEAVTLRKNFIFYIVPMLNPDGVIYGNYRCSLLGADLNRRWINPNRFLFPTIYHCKNLIRMVQEDKEIQLYVDFHGHSMKENIFMFCCDYQGYEYEFRTKNALMRVLPVLLSQKNKSFSFKDCRFKMEKVKESTARIVVFREFNVLNSFTLESSFFRAEWQKQNA